MAETKPPAREPFCSFCGRCEREVARLVIGPECVSICNICHDVMRDLMPAPSNAPIPQDWPEPPTRVEED